MLSVNIVYLYTEFSSIVAHVAKLLPTLTFLKGFLSRNFKNEPANASNSTLIFSTISILILADCLGKGYELP